MRGTLRILFGVALATATVGCKGGPGDVDRPGTPAHGQQLFEFPLAGSNTDQRHVPPSALARVGEAEALAIYASTAMTSAVPGAYLRTVVQAQRATERGRRWQVVDYFANPTSGRQSMAYGEPPVLYPGRGTAWVMPAEGQAYYPVFYSGASDTWRPLLDLTQPMGCQAAADEEHDRAYLACRDYRSLKIDVRDLTKEGVGKQARAEIQGEGMRVAVDTEQGAQGTAYVAVSPAVRSDPLRIYAIDGTNLGEVAVVPDPEDLAAPVEIPPACEGCRFGEPKGYAIVDGKHHLVVEVADPEVGETLWHFVGDAKGPFAGKRVDVDGQGGPLGGFIALQAPLPGKSGELSLVLARQNSCLHVLRLSDDGAKLTGSLPFVLAVNEGGAVVWDDGSLGWLSGTNKVDYYLGQPSPDATCQEPTAGDGGAGGDAGPDGRPDYQTGGNVIKIRRTAHNLDVAMEPGGENQLCGVGYTGTTGRLGCHEPATPDACGAAPKAYDQRFGMGSLCYDMMLTLTFVDQQGLGPSIDVPRVSGWFEVPPCYGNDPCQVTRGESFKMTWEADASWSDVRIEVRDRETKVLYEVETDNDGEHTLPAEVFAKVDYQPAKATVQLERFREIPFDFPVADGSYCRAVQEEKSGTAVTVVDAP